MALLLIVIAQFGVADLAEGGELGARADGTGDPSGLVRGGVARGHVSGQAGGGHVELVGAIGDPVLTEGDGEGAERVGLDDLAADLEIRGVELSDDIGSGDGEQFVAPLEVVTAEILGGEPALLDTGAHATVEDHDSAARCVEEAARGTHGGGSLLGGPWWGAPVVTCMMGRWRWCRPLGRSGPTHQDSSGLRRLAEGPLGSARRWEPVAWVVLGCRP